MRVGVCVCVCVCVGPLFKKGPCYRDFTCGWCLRCSSHALHDCTTCSICARCCTQGVEVRQGSWVTEVQRIQGAILNMVLHLVEYKSFMPAGLFHRQMVSLQEGDNDSPAKASSPKSSPSPRGAALSFMFLMKLVLACFY